MNKKAPRKQLPEGLHHLAGRWIESTAPARRAQAPGANKLREPGSFRHGPGFQGAAPGEWQHATPRCNLNETSLRSCGSPTKLGGFAGKSRQGDAIGSRIADGVGGQTRPGRMRPRNGTTLRPNPPAQGRVGCSDDLD